MPVYTFPPGVVLNQSTGALAVGATGVFRSQAGAASEPIFDLNGSALPNLVVGSTGAHASFKADLPNGVLDFGSVQIPVIALEAMSAALDAQAAAEAAAASAEAAANSAASKADIGHTHEGGGGGGTGTASGITVDGAPVEQLDISSAEVVRGPSVVVPPAATFSTPGMATWPSANYACMMRFTQTAKRSYRHVNFAMDTASGSIEAAVVRLSGTDYRTFTKVASTGVIPATNPPGTGLWQHVQLTADAELPPGEYALVLWCNNTTVRCMMTGTGSVQASRLTADNSFTGGVPANGTIPAWGGYRYVGGMTMESAD